GAFFLHGAPRLALTAAAHPFGGPPPALGTPVSRPLRCLAHGGHATAIRRQTPIGGRRPRAAGDDGFVVVPGAGGAAPPLRSRRFVSETGTAGSDGPRAVSSGGGAARWGRGSPGRGSPRWPASPPRG